MNGLVQDVRHALRSFRKWPAFTAAVILTLALAFGASTAIFSLFSSVVLRMPFTDSARLLRIHDARRREDGQLSLAAVSQRNFFEVRARARSFEGVVAGIYRNVSVRSEGGNQRFAGIGVSEGWLAALGVHPILGRDFTSGEERQGSGARSALVSYNLWKSALGGARDLSSRRMNLDGSSFEVIGVLPCGFRFPWESDIWFPWTFERDNGREHGTMLLARLKRNISLPQARSELGSIADELAREYPETNRGFLFDAGPIADSLLQDRQRLLEGLAAAVGLLLLIACTNVASLLLARSLSRQREFSVRRALGATMGREIRRAVVANLSLTLPAAGLGIGLSSLIRTFLGLLLPDGVASAVPDVAPGVPETVATVVLSIAVAISLALFTTLRSSRQRMTAALSASRSPTADREAHRALHGLVIGELALALVLLSASATLLEHFLRLQRADLGFESRNLLTASVAVPPARDFGPGDKSRLEEELARQIAAVPGVIRATAGDHVPLMVSNTAAAFAVEGRDADPHEQLVANYREVAGGYFQTLAIRMLRGRVFDSRDTSTSLPVCIVSRSMAKRFFRNDDPVGKRIQRIRGGTRDPWQTIVGVVEDVREPRLAGGLGEAWYSPAAQNTTGGSSWEFRQVSLAVRTASGPGSVAPEVRAAIARYDPSLTVYDLSTGTEMRDTTFAPERTSSNLLLFFAGFGVLLATSGTYAVLSYVVGRNRAEIGVRAALGASPRRTLAEQLGRGGALVAIGLAAGSAGAAAIAPFLSGLASEASTPGAVRIGGLALLLLAVGALACYFPARKAAKIDPMEALRGE